MRREERVTVQGPVKEQQPDGMSHRGGGLAHKEFGANEAYERGGEFGANEAHEGGGRFGANEAHEGGEVWR